MVSSPDFCTFSSVWARLAHDAVASAISNGMADRFMTAPRGGRHAPGMLIKHGPVRTTFFGGCYFASTILPRRAGPPPGGTGSGSAMKAPAYRREHALLGARDIPADAYYGIHTLRAL